MIEFDTQIIPTARAMSFLFSERVQLSKCAKNFTLPAGRRVLPGFNDLTTVRPDLAAQWHPTMNRCLKPGEVIATSSKEVWWKGECGHTWKAKVRDRTRAKSPGCPYCSGRRKPERPIKLD